MKRAALMVLAFLAMAGLLGFVITHSGSFGGQGGDAAVGSGDGGAIPAAQEAPPGQATPAPVDASAFDETFGAVSTVPQIGQRIVKNARIAVRVREGGFDEAFGAASIVAGTYGGYVASSSQSGSRVRSGVVELRLPAAAFEDALRELSGLGRVTRRAISGRDMTAEFVDLQGRLRTWESQEAVLLRLMRRATSIEATLRVQRELQDVQINIEQITGQLRLLEDQTSLATIQVVLREPGAPVVSALRRPGSRPSLAEAWQQALDGFFGVLYAVLVGLGYLVPLSVLAGVAWLAYRRYRTRATRPAPVGSSQV